MTTYAIGDIQGCHSRALALISKIRSRTPDARFIFVGDAVNRGPQSLAMLREVRALGDDADMVLGNHDLHLLAVANGIRKPGRGDTLDDILSAPDRDELLDWLRFRPMALREGDYLMVHAGLVPQWTAAQALELAQEVETALRGPDWLTFLRGMYGNEPARWDDRLQGVDRLRFIVNALTRIRFCSPDGTMDFHTKDGAGEAPDWLHALVRRARPALAGRDGGVRPLVDAGPGDAAGFHRAGYRLRLGRPADRGVPGRPGDRAGRLSAIPAAWLGRHARRRPAPAAIASCAATASSRRCAPALGIAGSTSSSRA